MERTRIATVASTASGLFPATLGTVAVILTLSTLYTQQLSVLESLVGLGVVVFLGLFLVACSGWLLVGSFRPSETNRVVAWSLAGTVPLAALMAVLVVYQQSKGTNLANPAIVVVWVASIGAVGGFCTGIYDIRHERRRRRLDETSEQLRAVIDTAPVAIIALDRDERVQTWNRRATEMFGWDAEDVLGEEYPLVPAEYEREYEAYQERVDEGAIIDGVETQRQRKDGMLVDVEVWAAPVERDGEITGHMVAMADVTERLAQERDLRLLKLAIEQAEDAVMITDEHGVIEYVNEAFVEMSGYGRREVLGRTPSILKSGKHDDTLYTDLWNTITQGEVWQSELVNRRKNGELFDVELTITPVEENGDIEHFVAIERDISDRKHDQQRLNVLSRVLRHNVRNAVTVVRNNAAILEDRFEGEPAELETIRRRAQALSTTAEKARTVERALESDASRPIAAGTLVEGALETVTVPDGTVVDIEMESDLWIRGDHTLETAIAEAIENAIQHTDDRHIEVHATGTDETVTLEIRDNGTGIPAHEREVLEDGDESALDHASGLGLWLMKWLVESSGGEIDVDGDDGTVVRLTLPATAPPERPAERDRA